MFIILILILVIIWFFLSKYKNNNTNNINEFSFRLSKYSPKIKLHELQIGDSYTLWLKPKTNQIYIYYPGYYLGEGYIGRIISNRLSALLLSDNYSYDSKVIQIVDDRIFLRVVFEKIDFEAIRENEARVFSSFVKKLNTKYNPQRPFEMVFNLNCIEKTPALYKINHVPLNSIIFKMTNQNKYEILKDSFWLEDFKGNVISSNNKSNNDSLVKIYRMVKSEHNFNIEPLSKIPKSISEKNMQTKYEFLVTF